MPPPLQQLNSTSYSSPPAKPTPPRIPKALTRFRVCVREREREGGGRKCLNNERWWGFSHLDSDVRPVRDRTLILPHLHLGDGRSTPPPPLPPPPPSVDCSGFSFIRLCVGCKSCPTSPSRDWWFSGQEREERKRGSGSVALERVLTQKRLGGPGSSPPTCRSKCGRCAPCKAVHVPIQPGFSIPLEYYPEAWRCKCGNKLFMP
ncbi:Epidermal patterning factor-like protein 4 [Vitis vinifera]|uniref:Epidermal patterning factor-like protein n=1 Tax=Vitis vinifera TaxID=29760 RepID=A0A438KM59_VITVI|nr:Epidermal patterning factor-like protein 4 [Vitis vinifera]